MNTNLYVAIGIIINSKNEILLGLRPDNSYMSGYWEFPGGKIEQNETSLLALIRELKEELAIDVEDASPFLETSFQYPHRTVHLSSWVINKYTGTPHGAEGQTIQWTALTHVPSLKLLPANKPIIDAVLKQFNL